MNRSDRRAQMREQNRVRFSDAPTVPRSGPSRSIALHIDELVLHGFPVQGRHAVGDAVQAELTRLMSASGLPEFVTNARPSGAIDGGAFHVTPEAKPNAVGNLIANAVYGGRRR